MHDPADRSAVSPLGPRATSSTRLISAARSAWGLGEVTGTGDLGGTYNLNLRLSIDHSDVVLRVYRPWVSPERLAATQALRAALHRRGLPALPPIPTASGAMAITVDDRLVELEAWRPDDGGTTTLDRLLAAADLLGRLHDGLRAITPDVPFVAAPVSNDLSPAVFADWLARTRGAVGSAPRTEPSRLALWATNEAAAIAESARAIPRGSRPRQLVHGDYGHENVRFTGSVATAIVDFDFVEVGERIADVADLAFSPHWMTEFGQLDRSPADRDGDIVPELIRRYDAATDRPLSDAEVAALPLAMAAIPLNWIAASWLLEDPVAAVALVAPELPTAAWLVANRRELATVWMAHRARRGGPSQGRPLRSSGRHSGP